jgi:hypothetical protein
MTVISIHLAKYVGTVGSDGRLRIFSTGIRPEELEFVDPDRKPVGFGN